MTKTTAFAISHIGTTRQNHEDNFLLFGLKFIDSETQKQMMLNKNSVIREFGVEKDNRVLLSVSDGMGGHNAGEMASLIAVSMLSEYHNYILSFKNIGDIINAYQDCINDINLKLLRLSKEDYRTSNMGATLTSLIISDETVIALNIGDSRIYRFNGTDLNQITKDNTEGQRLLELNLLTLEEVKEFPARKSLSRYLGMDLRHTKLKADINIINNLYHKEWFILCSDGLSDVLYSNEIEDIIKFHYKCGNIELACNKLIEAALDGVNGKSGSTDNITVVVGQLEL